ncbi:MAG: hypothetical protein JXX29_13545 [Deltaproteobacteria bacterium]|nr:hypothetical protein [Deltaproteobacteria bacterium]MBN2672703.1 hypothetical protein [Deltaproteobacteria bacterium]
MLKLMKRILATMMLTMGLLIGMPAFSAHPSGTPPQGGWKPGNGITFGGGAAYLHGGEFSHAFLPSVELSYFHKLKSPLMWWLSGGGKFVIANETVAIPFWETGLNMLMANLGVGYGVGLPDTMGTHHINLFVGLSAPVYIPRRGRLLYLQLYYRPIWSLSTEHPTSHEMGVMLKWLISFTE